MAAGARAAFVLAGMLGGFLPVAGSVAADENPVSLEERSVAWTSREDFEGGGVAGSGGTLRRNIDTTTASGDVTLRRKASSWQPAGSREKLFDSGRLNIGLILVAGSSTGEYLAAWGEIGSGYTDVLVQRVSASGTPVGAAQRVGSGRAPRLAEDAKRGRFLAAYRVAQSGQAIMGRLLKADGAPLGKEVVLAAGKAWSVDYDLLWLPGSGGYLLVWSDQGAAGDGDLFARRIGADGLPQGKPWLVSGRPGDQARPRLVFRRKSRDQVVVFEEQHQDRTLVLARRLDAQGSPAGEEFVVAMNERGGSLPAAVGAPGGDAVLVAWDDQRWVEQFVGGRQRWNPAFDPRTRSFGRDLYARVLAGDEPAGGGEFLLAGGRFNQTQAAFAAGPDGGQILAVWQDGRRGYENWDILAAAFEADGAFAGEEFPLDAEEAEQLYPVAAYNGRQSEFLAAWEDAGTSPGHPAVYCRRVVRVAGARGSIEGLRADSGYPGTAWRALSWDAEVPGEAALRVRTRTAEEAGDLRWAPWSEPLERPGLPPRSPAGRWLEVRVEFDSRDGKAAPVLHDIGVAFTSPRAGGEPGAVPPSGAEPLPEPPRNP